MIPPTLIQELRVAIATLEWGSQRTAAALPDGAGAPEPRVHHGGHRHRGGNVLAPHGRALLGVTFSAAI